LCYDKDMEIHIVTLFPKMFEGPFAESIIKRAQQKQEVVIHLYNLRDWAVDKHKTVDDRSYGGGAGMVMRVDVIDRALSAIKAQTNGPTKTILLSASGRLFDQNLAHQFSRYSHLILICGHYEGVDARVSRLVDEEISIGNYVLTGGELPAMVLTDAVVRLLPGVLHDEESLKEESFSFLASSLPQSCRNLLEYPQYTRPKTYKGMPVPKILLSGDHRKIAQWRMEQALKRTAKFRPELIKNKNAPASKQGE